MLWVFAGGVGNKAIAQTCTSYTLIVANYSASNITRYNTDGTFLNTLISGTTNVNAPNSVLLYRDTLYVASSGYTDDNIRKFNPRTGALYSTFATGFNFPEKMIIGPDGNMFVTDYNNNLIKRVNIRTGAIMNTYAIGSTGLQPVGIEFVGSNMYVTRGTISNATGQAGRIERYTLSNNYATATLAQSIPYTSATPRGITLGPDGNLYIIVYANSGTGVARIERLVPGASATTTLLTMDAGSIPYQGISWSPDGFLYVADFGENEVQVYNSSGVEQTTRRITTNLSGPHYVQFYCPCAAQATLLPPSLTICSGTSAPVTISTTGTNPQITYTYATGSPSAVISGPTTTTSTSNTVTITSTVTTTYSVTAVDRIGCSTTASGNIVVKPVPAGTATSTTATCAGPATVTGGSSIAGSTYAWTGPNGFTSTAQSFTTNTPGTYSLTVSFNGCADPEPATVNVIQTVTPPQNVAAGSSNVITCAQPRTTVSVSTSTAGVTYRWVGPNSFVSTAQSFTTATTGTYSVTVTNTATGCTTTASTAVTSNLTPPTVALSSATICAGSTATLTATPGLTSYVFSPALTQAGGSSGNTASIVGSGSGTTVYSVTATNAVGCTATASGSVTVNPNPVVTLNSATVCAGQSATLTAAGGTSYTLTPGNLTNTTGVFVVNTATPASYTVLAQNASGCTATATGSVTISALPVATLSSATLCAGQSTVLTATGGVSYTVTPGNLTSTSGSFTLAPSATTTYTVVAANASGCTASATGTVTVRPTPVASASSTTATCAGPATVTGGSSIAGSTYAWTGPNGFTSTAQSFTTNTPGIYTLVVTTNGCTSAPVTTTVVQDVAPPVVAATGGQIGCQATSLQLAVNATPAGTYRWTGPNSFTSSAQNPTVSAVGTYTVTVTNTVNGCVTTDTAVVSRQACASLGDLVFEDTNANGIRDAAEPGISGVTVQLFLNGSATAVASTTTNASGLYSFTGLTPGSSFSYVVGFGKPAGYSATTANQGGNDATDSDADTVTGRTGSYTLAAGENNLTVDAGFFRPAALGDLVFLDANRNGVQDAGEPGIGGVTVQLYTGTSTLVASTTTSASGLYSFTGLTPGVSYSVAFGTPTGYSATTANQGGNDALDSDANPATGRTGSYTLASNETNSTVDAGFFCVPPVVSATGGVLTCANPTLTLQVSSTLLPATYQWTGPNGFTSTAQNPTVNLPGTYSVVVTSNAGCAVSASAAAVVTQDITPPQALNLTSSGLLSCTATTVTLTASSSSSGLSYAFAGPGVVSTAGATALVSQTGTYTVTATGANGCTATATTTVSQTLTSATVVQGVCNGNNTNATTADDYYTLSVQATPGVRGPSNRFEVVLNGTVLNPGGTSYGQSVTVGSPTTFKADGVTTYTLIIRDRDSTTCQTTRTTTPVASCSTCEFVVCPKVSIQKR